MYRTAVIIGKISPDRAKRRGLIRPEGTYFLDNDHRPSHYPAYYTVACQHGKKT